MKTVSSELDALNNVTRTKEKISYEDFLVQYDGTHAEWINGEVVVVPPASAEHQDIGSFLENLLRPYTESRNLGKLFRAPFQMKLESKLSGREPDLLYIASSHLDRLKGTYLDGAADMAVEIISKDSINRDRGEKFVEYEAGGVLEYWLIDPIRQQAEFYRLGADNLYHPVPLDDEGVYHSEVVKGFWLRASWLWQKPLPPILEVWKELNLL